MNHRPPGRAASAAGRSAGGLLLILAILGEWGASPAAAQGQPLGPRPGRTSVLAAGDEDSLWICQVGEARSQVFLRSTGAEFSLGDVIFGRIEAAYPVENDLLIVLQDGSLYRHDGRRALVESNLPDEAKPIDLVGDDTALFALTRSRTAERLSTRATATRPSESAPAVEPFDAGSAPLSLVKFAQPKLWTPVAACPPQVDGERQGPRRPRLLRHGDTLMLFALEEQREDASSLRNWTFDATSREWEEGPAITLGGRAAGFWAASVSGVPTLVAALRGDAGVRLETLRRLGGPEGPTWQPSELTLSEPTEALRSVDAAFGFNQHVALLTQVGGKPAIVFGFFGGAPLEKTILATSVFERPVLVTNVHSLLQLVTMVTLIVLLVGMWTFRRSSLLEPAPLPEQWESAGGFQRAAAFLIDFAVFSFPAASVLGVSWLEAIGSLASWAWAFTPESRAAGALPDLKVLGWWALSCGGLTVYSFVMELLTGRTIGKVLARIRVVTERGERPSVLQVFVRNVLRPVELWPQFWVLTLLVILSRNQQRLGDVFALTLVVRPSPRRISHTTRREGEDETDRDQAGRNQADGTGSDDAPRGSGPKRDEKESRGDGE